MQHGGRSILGIRDHIARLEHRWTRRNLAGSIRGQLGRISTNACLNDARMVWVCAGVVSQGDGAGVRRPGQKALEPVELAELVHLYRAGWSTRELGEHFDRDHTTVMYWLTSLGVPIRTASEATRARRQRRISETQALLKRREASTPTQGTNGALRGSQGSS